MFFFFNGGKNRYIYIYIFQVVSSKTFKEYKTVRLKSSIFLANTLKGWHSVVSVERQSKLWLFDAQLNLWVPHNFSSKKSRDTPFVRKVQNEIITLTTTLLNSLFLTHRLAFTLRQKQYGPQLNLWAAPHNFSSTLNCSDLYPRDFMPRSPQLRNQRTLTKFL